MNILQTLADAVELPDRRPIWEWAHEHVDFGSQEAFKGHYSVENVPWTKKILENFTDPLNHETTAVMPPQESGKTLAAEVCMLHRICTQPARMSYNITTNQKAGKFHETKFQQVINACDEVRKRMSDRQHDSKRNRIIWRDGSFLLIQGVETADNRQSDSIEVQVNDEVMLWERPFLKQIHTRLRAYKDTAKIINISLGGLKNSELYERFAAGAQREWNHRCIKCGELFEYVFNHKNKKCNIHFNIDAARYHSDGRLDLSKFEETVWVNCPHCDHKYTYDEKIISKMNREGEYVAHNMHPEPGVDSLHVNAFAIGRRPWYQILEPWVRLNLKGGVFNMEILKTFITEDLAEFWEEKPQMVNRDVKLGTYTREEMLKPGSWPDEFIRVMSVDNQKGEASDIEHRWFVCRAFSRDGRSRLVDCGRINEWADVRKKQIELGVPLWTPERPAPWVVVDQAYDPTKVHEQCWNYKWFGMLGQPNDEWIHGPDSDFAGMRMYFSDIRTIDTGYGTKDQGRCFVPYVLWSSQKIQDLLAQLRGGKAEAWELPMDLEKFCPEYFDHINSHRQILEETPKNGEKLMWRKVGGAADHLYDCESMIVVIAMMADVLKNPFIEEDKPVYPNSRVEPKPRPRIGVYNASDPS